MAENSEKDVVSLTAEDARAEFLALEEQLRAADLAYHQADAPEISDAEYDLLKRRYNALAEAFPELAEEASLLEAVGAPHGVRIWQDHPCCADAVAGQCFRG